MSSDLRRYRGHAFWLFGLSGAGKSTLATRLSEQLRAAGEPVLSLDGDALRANLCRGLGYSETDRTENLRRAAAVARIGLESGLIVVAAFITPLESQRALVADTLPPGQLSWVHVDAPIDVCRARDVKGLYAGAQAGRVSQMTGVSAAFEMPHQTDLVLHTASESIGQSADRLHRFALERLVRATP